jgi:hypothetical protein
MASGGFTTNDLPIFDCNGNVIDSNVLLSSLFIKSAQTANTVYAGPSSGSAALPTFRAIVPLDLPVSSSSALGAAKCDGTTITCVSGVYSAVAPAFPAFIVGEVPSGTVNGSNVTFTLANTPNPSSSLGIYFNGLRQRLTTDYTLSSATITFTTAPDSGGLLADYQIPGGTIHSFALGEVPSGTVNGTNVTFTLAHTPISSTLALYFNGLRERQGTDYTLSGATATFTTAPDSGGLLADYQY